VKDTTPDVEAAFMAMFAERSANDRLKMTCAMFDTAKALVAADLRSKDPGISPVDLRVRMFERLYFGDFDAGALARFVAALR